ncbi:hypothetical protein ZEAMMB73_Zm00001d000452, partial [Zea mays]
APPISAAPELRPLLSLPRFCRRKRRCESSDPTRKRRSPPRGSPERTPGYRGRNPPPRREVAPALKWSTGRLCPPQLGGRVQAGGHGGTRVEVYASTSSSRGWWGRPGDVSQIAFGLLQQRCEDEVLEVAQRDHELVTEPAQQPRALDLAPTGDPHCGLLSRITPHLELHRRLNLPGQGHVPCGGYKNVGGLYNSIAW